MEAGSGVIWNNINIVRQIASESGQASSVVIRVIDIFEEDVFEEDFFVRAIGPGDEGVMDLSEGESACDGHEFFADVVGGGVDADGEVWSDSGISNEVEFVEDAGGRERHADGSDVESVDGGEYFDGAQDIFGVHEGFAHAHEDEVDGAGAFGSEVLNGPEGLLYDFGGGKIAFESQRGGGAKGAVHGAAYLR